MSDSSSLFGELRRFAKTSGAVGGIAARVAGERVFGIKTDRAAHAEDLKTILGGLKGPLMKVAQFLSSVPDALPAEYAEELAHLQANAPPMGWIVENRFLRAALIKALVDCPAVELVAPDEVTNTDRDADRGQFRALRPDGRRGHGAQRERAADAKHGLQHDVSPVLVVVD